LRCYELEQRGREGIDLKALSKTTAKAVIVTPLSAQVIILQQQLEQQPSER
jgi:hypothetical protein